MGMPLEAVKLQGLTFSPCVPPRILKPPLLISESKND